jgi:cell division protein FtsQ
MARKSSGTILQEELYPASNAARPVGAAAREELDDARLIDLDVDEESPFLRAQKRVSARRGSLPKKTASRLLRGMLAAAILGLGAVGGTAMYHYGERSWRFRIESSDNIEITGMQNVTRAQIMEVMGADIGRNIFFVPLAQQKAQLEQIPWVESASVMRFVPNRITVEIHERTPVAFARVGSRISLIDAGGTLMELPRNHKYSFPVIIGMYPGEPLSTRVARMKAYNQLVRELDSGGARYSQDLSEVEVSDLEDLKVRANDAAGDVLVELGSSDFLKRYETYVSHVQEWRQQFQKLESVNLRYDNQVIVNPDMEALTRRPALSNAAVRVAAAAGVKPAALLTPVEPHDRALPKPAFELSAKKLEPKPAARKSARTRARRARAGRRGSKRVARARAAGSKPGVGAAQAPPPQDSASRRPAQSAPATMIPKPSPAIARQSNMN